MSDGVARGNESSQGDAASPSTRGTAAAIEMRATVRSATWSMMADLIE